MNQAVKISDIKIGQRFRKDLGDLNALAESIKELTVLQPIVVTLEMELVCGERTLLACRDVLGWETIPAKVCSVKSVLLGQVAPNLLQKTYTVSERVAIADALRSYEHGGDRRSDQRRNREDEILTVDEAAKRAGLGGKDGYFRAKTVLDKGVPELIEAMDKEEVAVSTAGEVADLQPGDQMALLKSPSKLTTQQVRKYQKLRRVEEDQEKVRQAALQSNHQWIVTADQSVVPCHLLITDPPFGLTNESWEPKDVEGFTRDWCKRWSNCGADFMAIFWCQGKLREGWQWFDESLAGYEFQQMLVWHANNHCGPKSRNAFKMTWYPILLYRRVGADRMVITDSKTWDAERHQLDCHVAPVPQTGYSGHQMKQHPCQKPVSVMRWLINALSEPGELVVDSFCGSAASGIAALQLGRQFHGIETNEKYRRLAEARLATNGHPEPVAEQTVPSIQLNEVTQGNCLDLIPALPNGSINLVLTSPPYADQRKSHYPGVPENQYAEFTLRWMEALWPKLKDDGSVLIVIDPHVEKGIMADYVLRTQLALRDFGWKQHRTQIWNKPNAYPLGHTSWTRHAYEEVLWFSKTEKPFCDPKACGQPSKSLNVNGYSWSEWSNGHTARKNGVARTMDVLTVSVGANEKGVKHPAQFPVLLAERLIETFSPKQGTILDNFCGSGSTLIAAKKLGRCYYGFDLVTDYCEEARRRLLQIDGNAA